MAGDLRNYRCRPPHKKVPFDLKGDWVMGFRIDFASWSWYPLYKDIRSALLKGFSA